MTTDINHRQRTHRPAHPVPQQQFGPVETTSEEDIDEQFTVNFRSHWTAMTAEAELMRRGDRQHVERSTALPRPPR